MLSLQTATQKGAGVWRINDVAAHFLVHDVGTVVHHDSRLLRAAKAETEFDMQDAAAGTGAPGRRCFTWPGVLVLGPKIGSADADRSMLTACKFGGCCHFICLIGWEMRDENHGGAGDELCRECGRRRAEEDYYDKDLDDDMWYDEESGEEYDDTYDEESEYDDAADDEGDWTLDYGLHGGWEEIRQAYLICALVYMTRLAKAMQQTIIRCERRLQECEEQRIRDREKWLCGSQGSCVRVKRDLLSVGGSRYSDGGATATNRSRDRVSAGCVGGLDACGRAKAGARWLDKGCRGMVDSGCARGGAPGVSSFDPSGCSAVLFATLPIPLLPSGNLVVGRMTTAGKGKGKGGGKGGQPAEGGVQHHDAMQQGGGPGAGFGAFPWMPPMGLMMQQMLAQRQPGPAQRSTSGSDWQGGGAVNAGLAGDDGDGGAWAADGRNNEYNIANDRTAGSRAW